MKKVSIKILSLFLVVMTLVGVISLPVSAYSYPMNYTITYKTSDGKVLDTKSGTVDAAADTRNALRITSPSFDGYVLKNDSDAVVTGSMISWSFPASNYVRHGSGSYTVYYEKACKMVVHYVYGTSRRTATVDKTAYGKRGSGYTIYSPTISGYTPSKSSVSGSFSSESSSATVYYYESTYTISFNANGGSGAPSGITKKHFTNATLPTATPSRTGYTFKGWGTSSSASYAAYQPGSTFYTNANTTLYAVWSAKTYTISYNANGGSGGPGSQTKTHGIKMLISRVEPTRSGYTFLGWSTSSSATSASYKPGEWYYANADRTFYAVWKKNAPATYTVSYDANGGSGAPGSQTKTQDITLTLSGTKSTRSGYTFLGWATSSSATSASYQPGGSYTANASVTLYAVWSCNHASTKTVWDTGCKWRKVCNNCGVTVSSGTTHGPYTYGDWVFYSGSQHSRYKTCIHGDYTTTEYASHNTSNRYEQYSASQHKRYSYCADCNSTVGSVSYEGHTFTSTTSNGQTVSTCSQCGYTKTTAQTYTYITPTVTAHATMVTTLIVGQAVTVNGRLYEGVVPKATVYQMPVVYSTDVMRGISQLANLGVSVINYSGGSGNTLDYASYDQEIDNILKSSGVSFVVSAGNTGNNDPEDDPENPQYPCITSPGKAYNAITVGNLRTKSGAYTSLSPIYSMSSSSSYDELSHIANKPDISAPGSSIAYVSSGTTITSMSGTSCAAPLITGIVAQLHQARVLTKTNPTRTKATLLLGASNADISTTNNTVHGNYWFRDRSGAGLANAPKTIDAALDYTYNTYSINLNTVEDGKEYISSSKYLDVGDTIRVVMAFDKAEDGSIPSNGYVTDIDLRILDANGNIKASSISSYNNVEIIEYTATIAGDYKICVRVHDHIEATSAVYLKVATAWYIE